jgi:hypothetical protein
MAFEEMPLEQNFLWKQLVFAKISFYYLLL